MFHIDSGDIFALGIRGDPYDLPFAGEASDLAGEHLHGFFIHKDLPAVVGFHLEEGKHGKSITRKHYQGISQRF